ncbi:WcaF family extracellular polysaccharide biosynthesis acetyltransferase [Parapedobacter koreensis]|uniref:Putative colanic acid biosynthesis acetyltransferase WcaF n=1 Tax=Parapedobacter koreensis TaxID=332977 RepID=A0A1H7NP06_9SPHI|nr:WcaF family extracellular polysaccharide biosynthesis acetyltransferase [Parapedobacter koreensis]SEL24738.1 putative colanic acid biosynthesis acetyltransferase WcaF [Parapedobacter koreensis]
MSYNIDTYIGPSFSLRNRIGRVTWGIVYLLFFRYSPRPLHAWRAFLLRLFGAEIGKGVHVYPRAKIWAPWTIKIGDESGISDDVNLYSQAPITIGKRVVISQGSYICTGTHDYMKRGFPLRALPIIIEDYAWIATEVFVHPGVAIGEGSVVGARSVVTKDTEPWMVCAGFPCKPIKERIIVD